MLDPIVRIQAGRLRRSLERYYLLAGEGDPIRIELPKGTYVPTFSKVTMADPVATVLEPQTSPSGLSAVPALAVATGRADGWPKLAVVRFEAAAAAPDLLDFTVLLEDKLTAELGRYHDVRVTVRSDASEAVPLARPGARFELLGRVRPGEGGITVTARLLDRTTGEQPWADEYHTAAEPGRRSGDASDVAHVIAARVAAENGVIAQALTGEYRRGTHPAGDPYAAILGSYHFFFKRDPKDFDATVAALQEAVAREPEVGLAWTQLARLYEVNYVFELSDWRRPIDEAIAYAHHGVRLDPADRRTRCVLASALLAKGELQPGETPWTARFGSNPGSLVYLEIIGYLLALLGDWERGIALARRAMERNPHHLPHVLFSLWADHLRARGARAGLPGRPRLSRPGVLLAVAHAGLQPGAAREERPRPAAQVAELLRGSPTFPHARPLPHRLLHQARRPAGAGRRGASQGRPEPGLTAQKRQSGGDLDLPGCVGLDVAAVGHAARGHPLGARSGRRPGRRRC